MFSSKKQQRRSDFPSKVITPLDRKDLSDNEPPPVNFRLVEPSPETRERNVLRSGELVYYDEPHAFLAILLMVLNPMWARDHDVRPLDQDPTRKSYTFIDTIIVAVWRGLIRLVQLVIGGVTLISLVCLFATSTQVAPSGILYPFGEWWWWVLILTITATIVSIWAWYMIPVAKRCRLVITEYMLWVWIDQRPWRDTDNIFVEVYKLNGYATTVTPLMHMFRTGIIKPSTSDNPEKLAFWTIAKDYRRLEAILAFLMYQKREVNHSKTSDEP